MPQIVSVLSAKALLQQWNKLFEKFINMYFKEQCAGY